MARLIDADALLGHIKTYCEGCPYADSALCRACGYGDTINGIEDATTIDAVPVVHGRWEKSQYNGYLVCSACRDVYVDNDWVDGKKWHYCPNCGARMDKDGDE